MSPIESEHQNGRRPPHKTRIATKFYREVEHFLRNQPSINQPILTTQCPFYIFFIINSNLHIKKIAGKINKSRRKPNLMISLLVTSPKKKKLYKKNLPWIKAKTKSFIHNTKIINNINNRILGAIYLIYIIYT